MDPKLFQKCIRQITNKFEVIRIEDYVLDKSLFQSGKYATIVFDDGYKDNIEFAADILNKYNVKSSFYVVTDCIDNNSLTWTHLLEYLFQQARKIELELPYSFLPSHIRNVKLCNKSEILDFILKFKPFLKTIAHEERSIVLNHITKHFSDIVYPKLMMNWTDIRQLNQSGHYIGSHGLTHNMLGTMKKKTDQVFELSQSATRIYQELGYSPISISYPIGSYNRDTIEAAKLLGYKLGLAVKQTVYNPLIDNDFEIPRIELYNEAWWKTQLRISNKLEHIKKLIRYK
ncbi:MAG: polysaccharide deacetylase family protein [Flavobacteriales bacterium]|nr:polysaccharide deacetylase family protein [Flavobacteriales bacterium]